ncbi:MAG: hypothetical protein QGI83_10625 [Candidatus Latescibacteria bacterium]|jgi:hypothetical protein|nr:hypothetical protein [Candidatus Latescibacterota bacterium]
MSTQLDPAVGPDVRTVGSRLELFLDDWLVDEMNGIGFRMHTPVSREVALDFDRPWEGPFSYDPVVVKEGDLYRLWYRGCGPEWEDQVTAYAESEDGVTWTRPTLGILEFKGSRENNIVLEGSAAKALCVFKDGNPAAPDAERYKAIGVGSNWRGRATLRGFVSPDGLRWEILDRDPILVAPDDPWPMFDSHNVAFWDDLQGRYVAYMRGWLPPGIRSIRQSASSDFRTWSEPEFIDMGDAPVEHLYKNACTTYFRAPHLYLMFPKRFVPERKLRTDWEADGISESVLMTSRDGVHWYRQFMEAFLRPGPDPNNWTDRNIYIGVGIVPTGPTEISLYHMEHYRHPSARLRRATLRTDGFVSVNAPYSGGELVTKPLVFDGSELVINFSTSAVGSLRAELQDDSGHALEGYRASQSVEIYGDQIERVVAWQEGSDVSYLAGKPVRVRFVMKDADLYSIQFRSK